MPSVVNEMYGNIPGQVIFWTLFLIAFCLFARRVFSLLHHLWSAGPANCSGNISRRILVSLKEIGLQRCSLKSVSRKDKAGIGHALMFWGFCLYLIGYIIFIGLGDGFGLYERLESSIFKTVYSTILDIAGLMVIIAVIWAGFRRYVLKPARLETTMEAGLILILIFSLMLLHFLIEGFGYAAHMEPVLFPPVGGALARLLAVTGISQVSLDRVYKILWWLHYLIILGFMVYVVHSKHLHILSSPANVFFRSLDPKGALKPVSVSEDARTFGVGRTEDFTWKQILDLYACTECGRCHIACPAVSSGKLLSPRKLILDLRRHLLSWNGGSSGASGPGAMIGDVVPQQVIWDCTTCRACQEVCPPLIEHIDKIVAARRHLVMESASIPETAEKALISIEELGHPWRGTGLSREDWADGLGIKVLTGDNHADVLLWVGCTGALEDRNIQVTQALARILKRADVDFGILGFEESCCGDPARRLGNEYLFQVQARKNIDILSKYGVKTIITACAHCFNALKNEYPQFGGDFEVIHHTQFIERLLKERNISFSREFNGVVTYHDPCYIGRHNDSYEPPRTLLAAIPGITFVEMDQSRQDSLCCGGGGGHLWLPRGAGQQICEMRIEQVAGVGAEIVATSCPWCIAMLEDGRQSSQKSIKILDIAEIIDKQL